MASYAVFFEDGLNQRVEAERPGSLGAGDKFGGLAASGMDGPRGWGLMARFVATNAAKYLTWLDMGGGAHGLDGHPLVVESLEEDDDAGGDPEVGRAVRFNGGGPQDALAWVITRDAHGGVVHGGMGLGGHCHNA